MGIISMVRAVSARSNFGTEKGVGPLRLSCDQSTKVQEVRITRYSKDELPRPHIFLAGRDAHYPKARLAGEVMM
jgi:hypothetical protein